MRISSLTKEYLYVGVRGAAGTEPVTMAVITGSAPSGPDWKTAAWVNPTGYGAEARILVGSGGDITLTAGVMGVWVKVVAGSETPVLFAGKITVT